MTTISTFQPTQASAHVLADSINRSNQRLLTVVATFARSALAEVNTHRALSRSSASSRAIPVKRLLASVKSDPFIPRRFSVDRPGMNAGEFIEPGVPGWDDALAWWLESRDRAVEQAERGMKMGLHKQDVNRVLEPYMVHTAIISSTEWENFFDQRLALDDDGNPLAYLPFYDVALAMKEAIAGSRPILRDPDRHSGTDLWHLPMSGLPQDEGLTFEELRQVSVARCARVSYFSLDGKRETSGLAKAPQDDMALFQRLLRPSNSSAPHLSPFEHVAMSSPGGSHGNFEGWMQMRQMVEREQRHRTFS